MIPRDVSALIHYDVLALICHDVLAFIHAPMLTSSLNYPSNDLKTAAVSEHKRNERELSSSNNLYFVHKVVCVFAINLIILLRHFIYYKLYVLHKFIVIFRHSSAFPWISLHNYFSPIGKMLKNYQRFYTGLTCFHQSPNRSIG